MAHLSSVLQTQLVFQKSVAREVITVPFNDINAYKEAIEFWGDEIAAVLVEPIVGNFGMVMPQPDF